MRLPNERTFRLSNGLRLFVRSRRYGRNRVTLVVTRDSQDNVLGSRTRVRRGREVLADMARGSKYGIVAPKRPYRTLKEARDEAQLHARVTRVSTDEARHFPIYILESVSQRWGMEYRAVGGQQLREYPRALVVDII